MSLQPAEPLDHDGAELALLEEQEILDAAYPWVRAWSQLIGLSPDQTLSMQRKAAAENAPATALIRVSDAERWVTLSDVEPHAHETRLWLLDWGWSRLINIPYEVLRVWLDPLAVIPSVILAPDPGQNL